VPSFTKQPPFARPRHPRRRVCARHCHFPLAQAAKPVGLGAAAHLGLWDWLREVYIADHNARFAIEAEQEGSAFVTDATGIWRKILCIQEERTVGNDNTVRWQTLSLQLPPSRLRPHFVKAKVRVHGYPDGQLAVFGERIDWLTTRQMAPSSRHSDRPHDTLPAHAIARCPGAIDALCLMYTTTKYTKEAMYPHAGAWTLNEFIMVGGDATSDNLPPRLTCSAWARRSIATKRRAAWLWWTRPRMR